ncbi:hypothetical protein [Sphingopyxis sp.]|uniref:hypothetical protein n=1 Tax=Sphingopyxis sp. TaxID=1908224 RepID=UPI003D13B644
MEANDPIADIPFRVIELPMGAESRFVIVAMIVALGGCGKSDLPDDPLFVGVENLNYADGTKIIQERLQTRFPKGNAEQGLKDFLTEQGFEIRAQANQSASPSRIASLKFGAFFCGSQVRVIWEADAVGRIENIEARYADTGCP